MNDLQLSPVELEMDECPECGFDSEDCDCYAECDMCMGPCDPYNHMSDAEMYEHDQREAFNDRLTAWRNEY